MVYFDDRMSNVLYDLYSVFEKKRAICFYVFVLSFSYFHMFVNDIWLENVDINKTTILINHKVLQCQWHHIYTTTNNSFTTTVCSQVSHMTDTVNIGSGQFVQKQTFYCYFSRPLACPLEDLNLSCFHKVTVIVFG